jgi:hypothetical protein
MMKVPSLLGLVVVGLAWTNIQGQEPCPPGTAYPGNPVLNLPVSDIYVSQPFALNVSLDCPDNACGRCDNDGYVIVYDETILQSSIASGEIFNGEWLDFGPIADGETTVTVTAVGPAPDHTPGGTTSVMLKIYPDYCGMGFAPLYEGSIGVDKNVVTLGETFTVGTSLYCAPNECGACQYLLLEGWYTYKFAWPRGVAGLVADGDKWFYHYGGEDVTFRAVAPGTFNANMIVRGEMNENHGGSISVLVRPLPKPLANAADADRDGLTDELEGERSFDPDLKDSDGDGVEDGKELVGGYDPLVAETRRMADSDADGLPDDIDPYPDSADGDGDGFKDWWERVVGSDPTDPNDRPDLGDVNGDGVVDNVDAVMLMEAFLELSGPVANDRRADADRNGTVDNVDAVVIFNWFLGNIASLPIE